MKQPNLFDYATSELSQDAFILWLLQWANPDCADMDKALFETAQCFVRLLLDNNELNISSVKCCKQKFHIDVFAIVNDEYFILIEDKTDTTEHQKQMTTYSQEIESQKEYKDFHKYCVYFKIGNESQEDIEKIRQYYHINNKNWKFKALQRHDILSVLNEYEGANVILQNYRERLGKLEKDYLSYKDSAPKNWSWGAWQGFCAELANHINSLWWGTVNAISGAFVCAAWSKLTMSNGCQLKLQIEGHHRKSGRLCIKIEMPTITQKERYKILIDYGRKIRDLAAENGLKLGRPKRYSSKGNVLTLACTEIENIVNEEFEINKILRTLTQYEELISNFVKIN